MISLTHLYYKEKNLIDGEHLAKGVDVVELFSRLPFSRCLSFLENYFLNRAIEANPEKSSEAKDLFTQSVPTQSRMHITRSSDPQLFGHGQNKPPIPTNTFDPDKGLAGFGALN